MSENPKTLDDTMLFNVHVAIRVANQLWKCATL